MIWPNQNISLVLWSSWQDGVVEVEWGEGKASKLWYSEICSTAAQYDLVLEERSLLFACLASQLVIKYNFDRVMKQDAREADGPLKSAPSSDNHGLIATPFLCPFSMPMTRESNQIGQ